MNSARRMSGSVSGPAHPAQTAETRALDALVRVSVLSALVYSVSRLGELVAMSAARADGEPVQEPARQIAVLFLTQTTQTTQTKPVNTGPVAVRVEISNQDKPRQFNSAGAAE
ncbi:hypothetical protein D9M70_230690 [compost metagenome]